MYLKKLIESKERLGLIGMKSFDFLNPLRVALFMNRHKKKATRRPPFGQLLRLGVVSPTTIVHQ